MNKRELIDKAVEQFCGVWCRNDIGFDRLVYTPDCDEIFHIWSADWTNNGKWTELCTREEFNKRSQELGWINGFKYGVEYKTNGNKPDLPDDVLIECFDGIELNWWGGDELKVGDLDFDTHVTQKFRIVDERYKPVSEISENQQNVTVLSENNQKPENVSDWHEKGEFPPSGTRCEVMSGNNWYETFIVGMNGKYCVYVSKGFEPYNYNGDDDPTNFRPVKSERERFVEAAWLVTENELNFGSIFRKMYDAGFRAPK